MLGLPKPTGPSSEVHTLSVLLCTEFYGGMSPGDAQRLSALLCLSRVGLGEI